MDDLIWSEFDRVDMQVGTVVGVSAFAKAKNPSYKLQVDFGLEIGVLKTSAQITKNYAMDDLMGRQVIAVVNFPKKQIADFMSECLILGTVDGKSVTLLSPTDPVPNGLRVG